MTGLPDDAGVIDSSPVWGDVPAQVLVQVWERLELPIGGG
jgi:hypothetical protein